MWVVCKSTKAHKFLTVFSKSLKRICRIKGNVIIMHAVGKTTPLRNGRWRSPNWLIITSVGKKSQGKRRNGTD
jgi:hypothetical protein